MLASRTPQRWRRCGIAVVATGAVLLALASCSGQSAPEPPAAEPTAEPTSLGDYDTSELTLVRGEFCARVTEGAVTAALGGESIDDASWQPGTRLPDSKDISNEFGCSWSTPSATARAWIFAPPIVRERAADFVEETVGMKCRRLSNAPAMGDPGVVQRCGLNTGATLTGFHGLVGDAWVGCEVARTPLSSASGSGSAETARVGEWCVAVLEALRTA